MNRFFICVILFAWSGCNSSGDTDSSPEPNVLVIFTDQQTNDALSYLGNPNLSTPAIDSIAQSGVFFSNTYVTSPVCGPSRSSLITGRMPHETGVEWNNGSNIKKTIPTMGQIFQDAGYNTAWAGKWHLPNSYPTRSNIDSVRGFKLLPFKSLDNDSWALGEDTDGPIADTVVDYLDNYEDNAPFLLVASLHNPHDICHVPRRPEQYAKANEIDNPLPPLPSNFEINPEEPQFLKEKRLMEHYGDELFLTKDYSEDDWRAYLYHYYRFTEMVDTEISKIMQTVDSNNLDENTIIVFTSEHGDGAASHKWAAKLSLYEETTKVPFSISYKNHIPEGVINTKALVSLIDLVPTLTDYAGITDVPEFTGQSLKPIIENPEPESTFREYLAVQLADDVKDTTRQGRMIRNERFKYNFYNQGENNEQLFDLLMDPGETKNLAYEPNYQSIKIELKNALKEWAKKNNDDFLRWLR